MATSATLHRDIQQAVVAVLRTVNYDDEIPTERVYDEAVLSDAQLNIEMPCVVASLEGETERIATPRTTNNRQIEFPVRVFILDRDGDVQGSDGGKYTRWRQRMIAEFDQRPRQSNGKVLGNTDVYDCEVVPKQIFDEKLPQYQMVVSGFVVWCKIFVSRE